MMYAYFTNLTQIAVKFWWHLFFFFHSYVHRALDLSEQLINPDEPDPIYDLFAVTVSVFE